MVFILYYIYYILYQSSLQIKCTSSFIIIITVVTVLFYCFWLQVHCTYLSHQNKYALYKSAPIMYWQPSIVLQLKMLKLGLGQESFSLWLWVMIQSCSSIRAVVKLMSYTV